MHNFLSKIHRLFTNLQVHSNTVILTRIEGLTPRKRVICDRVIYIELKWSHPWLHAIQLTAAPAANHIRHKSRKLMIMKLVNSVRQDQHAPGHWLSPPQQEFAARWRTGDVRLGLWQGQGSYSKKGNKIMRCGFIYTSCRMFISCRINKDTPGKYRPWQVGRVITKTAL